MSHSYEALLLGPARQGCLNLLPVLHLMFNIELFRLRCRRTCTVHQLENPDCFKRSSNKLSESNDFRPIT
jgi:hypothetical protein